MDNTIPATTADSVLPSTEQPEVVDEHVSSVDEEPVVEETPTTPTTPQAPLQDLDPLAELEKLTTLDPKVKETLKAGYLRQKDYTQKTQDIAAKAKAAEAYEHWSPIIGFLEKNPAIANSLFKKNPTDAPPVDYSDDPAEYAKQIRAEAKAEILEAVRKEREQEKIEFERNQAINEEIAQSEKLDERLVTDEVFAKQIAGWIKINYENDIQTGKISITEATKQALEAHKVYEESLRQKVLLDMNDKAKKKTMVIPSGNGSPLPTTTKGGKLMDMREAANAAEEEISSK